MNILEQGTQVKSMDRPALMMLRMAALLLLALMSGTDAVINIINTKADLAVGEKLLLLCKAGGEAEITWQIDGEEIYEEGKVTKVDEVSSKLTIDDAKLEDAGTYTCHCEFEGHTDKMSVNIYVHEGPSFGATEVYHEFTKGDVATVPCQAFGKPAVDVNWWRGQNKIPSDEGKRVRHMEDHSLRITNVTNEDVGTYLCKATIRGRRIYKDLAISVVVNAPPTVIIKKKIQKVMAGRENNVSLLCLVAGHPTPNISWSMPKGEDPTSHHFNSDHSELMITSVSRADEGEYSCMARNKIGNSKDTMMLLVFEAPEVYLDAKEEKVSLDNSVSLSCNVSGHPYPQLYWIKKPCGKTMDSTSGRVFVKDGVLTIEKMAPSDGGLYSCLAVSTSGNSSRDVALYTQPGPSLDMSVSPEATSLVFSLKTIPINGGTPIKSFALQWRRGLTENWKEAIVLVSDPLVITALAPYTFYTVRMAAMNIVGLGPFSATREVRTQGHREPDKPVLSEDKMEVEGNSLSVPVVQTDNGSSPLLHYKIRYRQEKEGAEWKEKELPAASSIQLSDLSFGADYRVEVTAINSNGSSSPTSLKVTVPPQPAAISKGGVVAIIMVIFLVLLIAVDATCCYTRRCGLLRFIGAKAFGRNFLGLKTLEEGHGTNGDLNLKGLDTPRGSIQHQQSELQRQSKDGRLASEVTCDKVPLTKNEKHSVNGDRPTANP